MIDAVYTGLLVLSALAVAWGGGAVVHRLLVGPDR